MERKINKIKIWFSVNINKPDQLLDRISCNNIVKYQNTRIKN